MEPPRTFSIAGIAGSLRKGSFNRALLAAAQELSPPSLAIRSFDLREVPLYDADVEAAGAPAAVASLREGVRASDGILFATPEYNHGVPGVLKNAVDWLSRPPRASALDGKPVGIVGASAGMWGTARGQAQLRQAFVFTNSFAMPQPEVLVARAAEKFDADGKLVDAATRDHLAKFLGAFAEWVARFVR
ncbi:MAG TPA: NADPH-dependent FMN reductase [Thermoanaerobaculia bacterium]|nr:NADPH-dependent FMN reductase [Thermoanaerobaculia bacterium]